MDGLRNLALATFEVADLTFSRERLEIPCLLLLFGSLPVVVPSPQLGQFLSLSLHLA